MRPGHADLFGSLVSELAEYLGRSEREVIEACRTGRQEVADSWMAAGLSDRATAKEAEDFYRSADAYLFDLVDFNANYPYTAELEALLRICAQRQVKTALDFGSGIGSLGIVLASAGMQVTLADVSKPLLSFCEWRFAKRGIAASFIHIEDDRKLPSSYFDLVTSFDVMEHIAEPRNILRKIADTLKPAGLFAFNVGPKGPDFPQHITSFDDVLSVIRSCGFRRDADALSFECFHRHAGSLVGNAVHGIFDPLWYKGLRRPAVSALKALGLKEQTERLLS